MNNTMNATIATTVMKTTNYNLKTAYIKLAEKSSNSNSRSNSKNSKDRTTMSGRVLGIGKTAGGPGPTISRSGMSSPVSVPNSGRA